MTGASSAAVRGVRRFAFPLSMILLTVSVSLHVVRGQTSADALEVVYDFYLDLGLARRYQASLVVEGGRSLFVWGKPLEMREEKRLDEFHLTLGTSDSIGSYTYTDKKRDRMISHIPYRDGKSFQVCESLPDITWHFSDARRRIGPYLCEQATGDFRGRQYEVWFTQEIPVHAGPWKLHGLPGLVVLARDRSGEIVFRLNTLKPYPGLLQTLEQRSDCLGIEAYADLQEVWASDMLKRMNAKLPRGARLSLGTRNAMERF